MIGSFLADRYLLLGGRYLYCLADASTGFRHLQVTNQIVTCYTLKVLYSTSLVKLTFSINYGGTQTDGHKEGGNYYCFGEKVRHGVEYNTSHPTFGYTMSTSHSIKGQVRCH